jgi:hypothetical protein
MVTVGTPRAPDGLGPAGRRFWRAVVGAYELSPSETESLRQAVRVVDLLERIDAQLVAEDLTVVGSVGQQKPHPLLAASEAQRRVLEVLLNALALPLPDELVGRRRSPAATAAAQARWRERRSS